MIDYKDELRSEELHLTVDNPSHNKGGHRERAIGLAQQALDEVQAGIDPAR